MLRKIRHKNKGYQTSPDAFDKIDFTGLGDMTQEISHLRLKSIFPRIPLVGIFLFCVYGLFSGKEMPISHNSYLFATIVSFLLLVGLWDYLYDDVYYEDREDELRRLYSTQHPRVSLSKLPHYSVSDIDKIFKGETYIKGVQIPDTYSDLVMGQLSASYDSDGNIIEDEGDNHHDYKERDYSENN